jgi:hypothetical protein
MLDDRSPVRAHVPELANTPLCEQGCHLFRRQALSEPGRAFAGERLGEVFPARERVERREERCLWVGDGPRDSRDPQGAFPEGLESERALRARSRSGSPLALVPDERFSPPPPALPLSERCPGLSIYGSSITSSKR